MAWEISQNTVAVCKADDRFSKAEIDQLEKMLAWQKADYESRQLSGFGLVKEKYVPNWFFEIFNGYIKLGEAKRDHAIKDYLLKECSMSEKRAQDTLSKLSSQTDILNEFYFYVRNRKFASFNPVTVEGLSEKQLKDTTYLSPVGAYNFLIYLRESPDEALADLKKGLPRK